jgi:hypothetical protein
VLSTFVSMRSDYIIRVLKKVQVFLLISLIFFCRQAAAQKLIVDNKMHHIRQGNMPEWEELGKHPEGSRLVVHFLVKKNDEEQTLSLRQYGVNQAWQVLVNDHKIGELVSDEKYATTYFTIAAGTLKQGENAISIEPVDNRSTIPNDIRIGHIILENRKLTDLLSETAIEIKVADGDSKLLIPSKITVIDKNGILQPVGAVSNEHLAVRAGCIYTGNGIAGFGLPAGSYIIYARRGFEYGIDSVQISVKAGEHLTKQLNIKREVPTEGWVSCDTHIHSLTHSGHGDATIDERALTIAGEGIELPVITEHNANIDIKETAEKMGVSTYFTPVIGCEVTTTIGHFNVFPIAPGTPVIDYKVKDWNEVLQNINKAHGIKAIILNHARDVHNDFRPFDPIHHISVAGISTSGWSFPANAMEVMNSGSQQQNILRLYEDWFGMLNRGYHLTAVGSSDSHDVSRFTVGQARTYIRGVDTNVANINTDEVLNNFRDGRTMVSFGLLAEMSVNKKYGPGDVVPAADHINVSVSVLGPGWIKADHVSLYANGKKIREASITKGNNPGVKWKGEWRLPRPKHDLFLVAVAEGPGKYLPFWPIAKPYQHDCTVWTPHVMGSTGAIWIDADNDNHFTPAYEYAKELIEASKGDMNILMKELSSFDEAVSVQAAAILYEKGEDLTSPNITAPLVQASALTKAGFRRFINALKELR